MHKPDSFEITIPTSMLDINKSEGSQLSFENYTYRGNHCIAQCRYLHITACKSSRGRSNINELLPVAMFPSNWKDIFKQTC